MRSQYYLANPWMLLLDKLQKVSPTRPSNVRSFLAEVESFPWESRSRKPIANNDPTTAKLPIRDRYLKIVLKAIIVP